MLAPEQEACLELVLFDSLVSHAFQRRDSRSWLNASAETPFSVRHVDRSGQDIGEYVAWEPSFSDGVTGLGRVSGKISRPQTRATSDDSVVYGDVEIE